MRVLVLTVVHDPEDARVRYRQIPALVAAGHEVTLAASFTEHGREMPEDIRAIDIARASGRHRLPAILRARRLLRSRAKDFDVVLMHDPELLLAAFGLHSGRFVWDVHEDTVATLRLKAWLPRFLRPPVAALARVLERSAERKMHLLLAEESYVDRFARKHPVIPNSVVPPEHVSETVDHRVVYIGRVSKARGAREMIELGRRLAPSIEVHVYGGAEPDCIEMLRTAHSERAVVWHGFVPNDE
ncbi:MAG: glycosyltransferase family 4 protein, partial [Actinomycetales bacterium]|nr:glycosyltransferase family 4 protein [Actinomycetales bacterium]